MIKYWMTGLVAIFLPLAAQAETPVLEEKLAECRAIESSVQRLDCYDQLAQEQQGAGERDEAAPTEQGRADFGMEHHRSQLADKIYIEIAEKWQSPHGAWRFITADGQEWHQTQVQRSFAFRDDEKYFIERGALGSFMLGYDGSNRTTRVRRVN